MCFARSKALNIRLSRKLITQSHGDRFCEDINKLQLTISIGHLLTPSQPTRRRRKDVVKTSSFWSQKRPRFI